jgi:FkbH-like protein
MTIKNHPDSLLRTIVQHPIDAAQMLRKKKALKRTLLADAESGNNPYTRKRIAILGGSTTDEVADMLEICLLARGIQPEIYQSSFNRYYEDAHFPQQALIDFNPELVYVHTSAVNIHAFPAVTDTADSVQVLLANQLAHFESVWEGIENNLGCPVLQNNVELPWHRPLGNLDGSDFRGKSRFISQLNELLAVSATEKNHVHIHDIHYLSARMGIDHWFNPQQWYLYKYAIAVEAIPHLATHLAAVIAALWGHSKKCLTLDLDNTLWGGVIGDEGTEGIAIGTGSADAEAFADFQRYVLDLKSRGIVLAACSKNDEAQALAGFSHPESILTANDFSAFKANWDNKPQNLLAITGELSVGSNSIVFIDDNPAEREWVRQQLPDIVVPETGSDVAGFIRILDQAALFESVSLSAEDLQRTQQYQHNQLRAQQASSFSSYNEFLTSLDMRAIITPFQPADLPRITQLINKTNQFNLTTRRCSESDVANMITNKSCITLSARLQDKFGDNGLVSVIAGNIIGDSLDIALWLMSCRVLKRGLEFAMLEQLCKIAHAHGLQRVVGHFLPTAKNSMAANFYQEAGFTQQSESPTESIWQLELQNIHALPTHCIQIQQQPH